MKKKTFFGVLFFFVFTTASLAAADGGFSASQYADAARGDVATNMLGYLFGDVPGYFHGTNTHIREMFLVFNTAVAVVAVLMLMINIIGAIIQTAHEGELLGRRFSTIWMPIRNVFGLAGIFPIIGGWSIGQAFMFLAAIVGIGIANLTWEAGVHGILSSVTQPTMSAPATVMKDEVVQGLLQAQLCAVGYNDEIQNADADRVRLCVFDEKSRREWLHLPPATDSELSQIVAFCRSEHPPTAETKKIVQHSSLVEGGSSPPNLWSGWEGAYLVYGGSTQGGILPLDYCGGVRIQYNLTPPSPIAHAANEAVEFVNPLRSAAAPFDSESIYMARKGALNRLAEALLPISQRYYAYHDQRPTVDELRQIRDNYQADVAQALASVATSDSNSFGEFLNGEGKSFIWAGSIFNKVAAVQRQIMDAANEPLEAVPPRASRSGENRDLTVAIALAKYDSFKEQTKADFDIKNPDLMSFFTDSMQSPALITALNGLTMGEDDLMVGLTRFGYALTTAALTGVGVTAGLLSLGGVANSQIMGFSIGDFTAALTFIGNFVLMAFIPLLFSGLVFAFYVPFIPMITWYGGILSWIIVVAEAVIAAPLWMLAHMEAEGEGMGQKTAHGYMYLLNLFFRPALMVIGLVLGWYIMQVYGFLLKNMLGIFFGSGYGETNAFFHSLTGFFMFIACIVVFSSLAMSTVNKAFSLIHVMPDQVITWVGGHFKGFGGEEGRESHQVFAGVARFGQRSLNKGLPKGKGQQGGGIADGAKE